MKTCQTSKFLRHLRQTLSLSAAVLLLIALLPIQGAAADAGVGNISFYEWNRVTSASDLKANTPTLIVWKVSDGKNGSKYYYADTTGAEGQMYPGSFNSSNAKDHGSKANKSSYDRIAASGKFTDGDFILNGKSLSFSPETTSSFLTREKIHGFYLTPVYQITQAPNYKEGKSFQENGVRYVDPDNKGAVTYYLSPEKEDGTGRAELYLNGHKTNDPGSTNFELKVQNGSLEKQYRRQDVHFWLADQKLGWMDTWSFLFKDGTAKIFINAEGYDTTFRYQGNKLDSHYTWYQDDYDNFYIYQQTEYTATAYRQDVTVGAGKTMDIGSGLWLADGMTLTVEKGAVLNVTGQFLCNGTIRNNGGTVILQPGAKVYAMAKDETLGGDAYISDGGRLILMKDSYLMLGNSKFCDSAGSASYPTGIRMENGATCVNFGTLIAPHGILLNDSQLLNRAEGRVYCGLEYPKSLLSTFVKEVNLGNLSDTWWFNQPVMDYIGGKDTYIFCGHASALQIQNNSRLDNYGRVHCDGLAYTKEGSVWGGTQEIEYWDSRKQKIAQVGSDLKWNQYSIQYELNTAADALLAAAK